MLIVGRARNVIGWILLGVGLGLAIMSAASAYAVIGIETHPGALPMPELAGAFAIGGALDIRSEPGHGTLVRGEVTLA